MRLKQIVTIAFLSFLFVSSTAKAIEPVQIYTSTFPPIVTDEPTHPGYAYEIIEAIFSIAGIDMQITQLPWPRAQAVVNTTPETIIFPLTRTPTREQHFDWSFVLFKTQTHFITLDDLKLTKETAKDKTIGVQRGSSWDNWLVENGYEKIQRSTSEGHSLVRMLKAKRIDAWYAEKSVAQNILPINKVFNATFSDPVLSFDTYLATNKKSPSPHMDALNQAFKQLIASGEYDEIMKKYSIKASQVRPNS